MSIEINKPYIVSADLSGLLKKWGNESSYSTPSESYIDSMADDLRSALANVFPENPVEVVSENQLRNGIDKLIRKFSYPAVSLDRAYISDESSNLLGYLDVSRTMVEKADGTPAEKILMPREGFPAIDKQIKYLASKYQGPVLLVDDVIFSGEDLVRKDGIFEKFAKAGIPVNIVVAGVGIGEGIRKINDFGKEIACVREYEDVIDEICERDFFASVPMSGRLVLAIDGKYWSAPYFKPFGDPESWASITASSVPEFSRFCLEQSIILWSEIEKLSQASISTDALPRKIRELGERTSIVAALREHLDTQTYLK